jgi:hypothetical protein
MVLISARVRLEPKRKAPMPCHQSYVAHATVPTMRAGHREDSHIHPQFLPSDQMIHIACFGKLDPFPSPALQLTFVGSFVLRSVRERFLESSVAQIRLEFGIVVHPHPQVHRIDLQETMD